MTKQTVAGHTIPWLGAFYMFGPILRKKASKRSIVSQMRGEEAGRTNDPGRIPHKVHAIRSSM